jgi:hypothetical protein
MPMVQVTTLKQQCSSQKLFNLKIKKNCSALPAETGILKIFQFFILKIIHFFKGLEIALFRFDPEFLKSFSW